jgi:hypothetical protein
LINTQDICRFWVADEMRIERFAMTANARESVQVGFQEIRPGPHLGEDDKAVESRRHNLFCNSQARQGMLGFGLLSRR